MAWYNVWAPSSVWQRGMERLIAPELEVRGQATSCLDLPPLGARTHFELLGCAWWQEAYQLHLRVLSYGKSWQGLNVQCTTTE